MQKIVLVNFLYSSNNREDVTDITRNLPIGLLTINDIFINNDIDSEIIDFNIERYKNKDQFIHLDYNFLSQKVLESQPTYIGITSMSNNYVNVILLLESIYDKDKDVKFFLGGAQATATSEKTLTAFPYIEFICLGESEKTIQYFCDFLNSRDEFEKIPGIMYIKNKQIIKTQEMNLISGEEIKPINYDGLINKYNLDISDTSFSIEGGRGCPYGCVFCSTSMYWKRMYRVKPVTTLKSEIEKLNAAYGAKKFSIVHDLFTCNKSVLHDFCQMASQKEIEWACSSRVDVLSKSDLVEMRKSGCAEIFFGIETGSQKLQKKINKNLLLEKSNEIIKFCSDIGINPVTSFIIGFPFENLSDMEETIDKAFEYACIGSKRVLINILNPEHNSEIMNNYKNQLIFEEYNYISSRDSVIIHLQKELDLIKKYPQLFNHYYNFKCQQYNMNFLIFVREIFSLIEKNYKETFSCLKQNTENTILGILIDIFNLHNNLFLSYNELINIIDQKNILAKFQDYIKFLNNYALLSIFQKETIKILFNKRERR